MTLSSVHDRSYGGSDLFDRAKAAADVESVAGVQLYRAGKMARGQCPLCGAGKGKKSGGPFAAHLKEKWFRCWTCSEHGDVIELERLMYGLPDETAADAARRILGEDKPRPERKARVAKPIPVYIPNEDNDCWSIEFAARIWKESVPALGTLVEGYLRARFIDGPVLDWALKRLRFHPMVYYPAGEGLSLAFPAMILRSHAPIGATGGIHITYLRLDGLAKADVPAKRSAKIMFGPQLRDGMPGGGWLTHPRDEGPLIVSEGVETGLSLACLLGRPCRIVAAMALDRLQGGWLAYKGAKDPDCPRPDPSTPAFTWPEPLDPVSAPAAQLPARPWGEVLVAIDHDMSPLRIPIVAPNGDLVRTVIDATARAKVCATLATAAWRATTNAAVRVKLPPVGQDFNDVLKERRRG